MKLALANLHELGIEEISEKSLEEVLIMYVLEIVYESSNCCKYIMPLSVLNWRIYLTIRYLL